MLQVPLRTGGRWSVRLRALNSPGKHTSQPVPLVCRVSSELSVCWQIERSLWRCLGSSGLVVLGGGGVGTAFVFGQIRAH